MRIVMILALTSLLSGCKVVSQFEVHSHFNTGETSGTAHFGFEREF